MRPGGLIAADVYRHQQFIDRWSAKRLWRPLTTRMPRDRLRRIIEWYIPRWLPIDNRLKCGPQGRPLPRRRRPVLEPARPVRAVRDEEVAWTILDTFDALAPRYDRPQSLESVEGWCRRAGLVDVSVRYGGNGIEVNARRPPLPT